VNKFDHIKVGQSTEITHTITKDDIRKFTELTGDDNRLHTDPDFAAKTSFKKPVVHGMLGASFISTIIGTKLPGDGALWFSQNLEFLLPIRVGDTLRIYAEVIKKDDRSRVIELKTDITNQHRQKVTQGVAKVKVVEQEPESIMATVKEQAKKTALVVGGSGGIGSAVCLALAAAGFEVIVHYNKNAESAIALTEKIRDAGGKASNVGCNITDQSAVFDMVDSIVRHLGPISVLVNCTTTKIAAINFMELVWNDFELHLKNQILGTFNLARAIVPYMEKQRYGKIINMDTQYVDAPESNLLPYISAKGALRGFSKSLARDLAPKGICVNMVSPGMTDTEQISDVPERIRLVTAAKTPLRRLATPEDVAKAVVFLSTEQSDFICGEIIRVNGGQVMI
jgi:3-oxoacyl-[acyl-carrier protein] reductase